MLLAATFVGLFVVLDLSVTWSHYASMLVLYSKLRLTTESSGRLISRLPTMARQYWLPHWKSCMQ